MTRFVSAARFKLLHRERSPLASDLGVRKQLIEPATVIDAERRTLRFCISTAAVDRENDTIALDGWDLTNYLRNPVVLWGHDASRLPIGRAFDIGTEGGSLMASVEFIPEDLPEGGAFAASVYRLAQLGFIAATSVGFRPLKWAYTDDKDRDSDGWFPGVDYSSQELVEFSIVTVPANPDALIEMPGPGEGTAVAGAGAAAFNEEQARARARRRRVLQLATARNVHEAPAEPSRAPTRRA